MSNKELVIKLSEHIDKIVEKSSASVEDVYEALDEIEKTVLGRCNPGNLADFDDFEAVKSISALSDIGYHGKEAGIIIGDYFCSTKLSSKRIIKLLDACCPIENIQHGANMLAEKKYSREGIFNIFGERVSPVLIALGKNL